jgi:hypothetical protein
MAPSWRVRSPCPCAHCSTACCLQSVPCLGIPEANLHRIHHTRAQNPLTNSVHAWDFELGSARYIPFAYLWSNRACRWNAHRVHAVDIEPLITYRGHVGQVMCGLLDAKSECCFRCGTCFGCMLVCLHFWLPRCAWPDVALSLRKPLKKQERVSDGKKKSTYMCGLFFEVKPR